MSDTQTIHLFDTIPGLRQLLTLGAIAGAAAAGLWIYNWSHGPSYTVLYSGLNDRDAADVTQALTNAGIQYKAEPGGTVRVAADHAQDARMKLAAQDLPQGGSQGMEMLQRDSGLGVSSFVEGARYQHALETELSRTIAELRPIQAARVHLAIPRASAFAHEAGKATASVLVELAAGRSLEPGQVSSIVHLVASSIPELDASRVTVIDQQGRLLSDGGNDGALERSAAQLEQQRSMESGYSRRITELLSPLLGAEHLSVQVHADLDFTESEEVHESYKPDGQVVRSEQTSQQVQRGPDSAVAGGGVPGATSNQPAGAGGTTTTVAATTTTTAPAAAGAAPTSESTSSTRMFELDRTISHVRSPVARVKRITVAALVDNVPHKNEKGDVETGPLSADELARIESLVKQAVGFDEQRGDKVSVLNAAFQEQPELAPPEAVPLWQRPQVLDIARNAGGALVLLALIFVIVRPALKSLTRIPIPVAPAVTAVAAEALPAGGFEATRALPGGGSYEQKLQSAKAVVAQDPKKVAQVVKNWVATDG